MRGETKTYIRGNEMTQHEHEVVERLESENRELKRKFRTLAESLCRVYDESKPDYSNPTSIAESLGNLRGALSYWIEYITGEKHLLDFERPTKS